MAEYGWRLVVPTMDNDGNPVSTALLKHIADEMAAAFGGVTVYPAAGCWDDKGILHCDTNMVLASAQIQGRPGPSRQQGDAIIAELARQVGEATGQRDVMDASEKFPFSEYTPGTYRQSLPAESIEPGLPVISQTEVLPHVLGRPST